MSRTKRIFSLMLAALMTAVIMVMPTAQVVAKAAGNVAEGDNADGTGKYISEVRVGMGKSKSAAAASLEGYTILKDDKGEYADLNAGAGSNSWIGSKGDKVVLLGYKTTNDPKDAITDLAVMNMDGGYSVDDYEVLMDRYYNKQILPMITSFVAAIQEYRENYNSANPSNRKRARFAHDMLDKLYDDDSGQTLGELLLNPTKFELEKSGSTAYDPSVNADIVTMICQSNGQATLSIENLLTRAADTSDTTWIERFVRMDSASLAAEYFPDMAPTDANNMLASIFDDDAKKLLSKWNGLREDLERYDMAVEYMENFDSEAYNAALETVKNGKENPDSSEEAEIAAAILKVQAIQNELSYYAGIIALYDYLESVEYFDEFTLLDYFSMTKNEAAEDMPTLYAIAASLSPGQRAGLEFMSLRELIQVAMADDNTFSTEGFEDIEPVSIYEGVDRAIYEKGGVAMTTEARRKQQAALNDKEAGRAISDTTIMCYTIDVCLILVAVKEFYTANVTGGAAKTFTDAVAQLETEVTADVAFQFRGGGLKHLVDDAELTKYFSAEDAEIIKNARKTLDQADELAYDSSVSQKLAIGCTVAAVVLTAVSLWMTYSDLCDYYETEFSPIPNYMVDEADITRKNEKNETIVIKNQTAYYKAALCNRTKKDEKFKEIGDKADLNGDVGRMWVALYSVKNAAQDPIFADSFKVVYGTSNVPLDYDRGIHKFGSGAAFDLNNTYYAWNHGKGGIYVYYKLDDTVPPRANAVGTVRTGGLFAAVGIGGILVGVFIGTLFADRRGRKKKEEAAA